MQPVPKAQTVIPIPEVEEMKFSAGASPNREIEERLSKEPRMSEFVASEQTENEKDLVDRLTQRERELQDIELSIQQGKLLVKHLLQIYKTKLTGQ